MTLLDYYLLFSDSYKPTGFSLASDEISLTFDDGPDPIYTPIILKTLATHHVKATFFLVGQQVEKFPELAKRIVQEGHSIGNHSWSHSLLLLQSSRQIKHEIDKTQYAIKQSTGITSNLFRAPWGLTGHRVDKILLEKNLKSVLWTQALKDWRPSSTSQIEKRFTKGLKGGAIYLMHDGSMNSKRHSIQNMIGCLGPMIEFAIKRGFKIKPLH